MSTDIPQPARLVLNEYLALVHEALPGLLAGVYIHGSLALGAFDPRRSDIDFIAITNRRCTATDIAALRAVHRALVQRYPHPQLEGNYLQWPDLGRLEESMPPHPHIHDGIFHPSGYHDINPVTWWVLKHQGIAVVGPTAGQLDIHVDWEDLIAWMRHNLSTYWASFTSSPRRMAWLLADEGVQWAVLGVLRQFYTFRQHAITSKEGAGRYGLAHTPRQWHHLIHEAIDIRAGRRASPYRSRIMRAAAARAFLQLIVAACRTGTAGRQAGTE